MATKSLGPKPAWKRLLAHPMGKGGAVILAIALFLALFGPWLVTDATPHANAMDVEHAALPMGSHASGQLHWLGTDRYGRDVYSRLVLGTRISLGVGTVALALSLLIGIPIGAVAGYYGGWVDRLLNGLIQVFWSIPTFLMVIALGFALGKGMVQVFIAVGLTMWVEVARLVRGQMIQIRSMEYIDAARVLGLPSWRIILVHALPQTVSALVVLSASQFASAILLESGYSKRKALIYNILASLATVLGGVLAYFNLKDLHTNLPYFLAVAASSFIYIAVADLIPSLHKKTDMKTSLQQIAMIAAGVCLICLLHGVAHSL
jgi:ABC-type dipeptide/oligopeptide/nickel transport system permease subunit